MSSSPLVELSHVSKSFSTAAGGFAALRGVDVSLVHL